MIRIFGAALVSFCGIYAAYIMNSRAKGALTQVEGLLELLRFLRSEIECFSLPIPKILSRCPTGILMQCGCQDRQPSTLSELFSMLELSDDAAAAAFEKFTSEIGRGYRDEQLTLCDYYIERLEERRRAIGAQLPSRRRVNSALCIAGALAIVIIFV